MVIAVCGLLALSCEVETTDTTTTVTLGDMQITDGDVQGWTVTSEEMYASADELAAGSFNGEAYTYVNEYSLDLKQATYQGFSRTGGAIAGSYVLEFGSTGDAGIGYSEKRAENLDNGYQTLTISGFDDNTATLFRTGVDYLVYAAIDRFLIKLELFGLGSDSEAQTQAASFLGFYRACAQ